VEFAPDAAGDRHESDVFSLGQLFLRIVPWEAAVLPPGTVDPRSAYVEQFWLPLLGPSATWLLRRLREGLERAPSGYVLDLDQTARCLGLGGAGGRHSPFRRAIARCARYEMARQLDHETLAVRRSVPRLTPDLLRRLPGPLRARHGALPAPSNEMHSAIRLGRLAALDLLAGGTEPAVVKERLEAAGLPPALASEAVAWAGARHRDIATLLAGRSQSDIEGLDSTCL
jgi:hypothetical protein